jgi:hypothetical protein
LAAEAHDHRHQDIPRLGLVRKSHEIVTDLSQIDFRHVNITD